VGIVSHVIRTEGALRLKSIIAVAAVSCAIWIIGILSGILSFRGRPPSGHLMARTLALFGIVCNIFLTFLGGVAIFAGDRNAQMDGGNGLPSQASRPGLLVTARDKQSIAAAGSSFGRLSSNLVAALAAAGSSMTNPAILDLASISNIGELRSRETNVSNFIQASQDLHDFYERAPLIFEDLLATNGVNLLLRKSLAQSQFNSAWRVNRNGYLAMRKLDTEIARYQLNALGLLETNWEAWDWDAEEDPNLAFDDEDLALQYYEIVKKITWVCEEQKYLQASLMRKLGTNASGGTNSRK